MWSELPRLRTYWRRLGEDDEREQRAGKADYDVGDVGVEEPGVLEVG